MPRRIVGLLLLCACHAQTLTVRSTTEPEWLQPRPGEPRSSLDRDEIRAVIHSHADQVRDCYERRLTAKNLDGRLAIVFEILPDGQVGNTFVQRSDLGDTLLEQCIVDYVHSWRFPAPVGGGRVIVTYPYRLKQGSPQEP